MQLPIYVKDNVVKGFGRGSKELGCPTANVDNINHLTMPTGIYCGLVQLVIRNEDQIQEEPGNRKYYDEIINSLPYISSVKGMVCSFGYNPQYGNKEKTLEVHILDNLKFNFYGAELRVLICKKMREETKFSCLEELKIAIANDIKEATSQMVNFEKYATCKEHFIFDSGSLQNVVSHSACDLL